MRHVFFVFLALVFLNSNAQVSFKFTNPNKKAEVVPFELINNLIVFPLQINGNELSFILDTGVNKTILFDLSGNENLLFDNYRKILVSGLGDGPPVEALISAGNTIKTRRITGENQEVLILSNNSFNLSSRMGVTIHGVIGYSLLKDLVVHVNYMSKKLTFYNPYHYQPKKCKSCEELQLDFFNNKPYVNVAVQLKNKDSIGTPVKFLVDSGGSDALWLFENSKPSIQKPEKYFEDILGEGFSGTIYGKRSRISKLSIGKFTLPHPTVSFLDTLSTFIARKDKSRNGSIGGGVLKRFNVWIDYQNKSMRLKKNRNFSKGFFYNMSGIQVVYGKLDLVAKKKLSTVNSYGRKEYNSLNSGKLIDFVSSYVYNFRPSFKIDKIGKESPAAKAGLLEGDIIYSVNGKPFYELELSDFSEIFQSKPNRKIKLRVKRMGQDLKYSFRLEKRI